MIRAALLLAILATQGSAQIANEGCGIAAGGNVRDSVVNCGVPPDIIDEVLTLLREIEERGRAQAARESGITNRAIIFLAQRVSQDVRDINQALDELEYAVSVAIEVQARGNAPSDAGPFVDAVMRRVAELSASGAYDEAASEIDEGLRRLEEAKEAILAAEVDLLEAGVDNDILRRDPASAAERLARIAGLVETDPDRRVTAMMATRKEWLDRGQAQGLRIEIEVSIELSRIAMELATTPYTRAFALYGVANGTQVLGERSAGSETLREAIALYREVLALQPREVNAYGWANTMSDLGTALRSLSMRETDEGILAEAIDTYRGALEVYTKEATPWEWAIVQLNLAVALHDQGTRSRDNAFFDRAIEASEAALTVFDKSQQPLAYARARNNLGASLQAKGIGANDPAPIRASIAIFREIATLYDMQTSRVLLGQSLTNLGNSLHSLGGMTFDATVMREGTEVYRQALEALTFEETPLEHAMLRHSLAVGHGMLFLVTSDAADLATARSEAARALEMFERLGSAPHVAQSLALRTMLDQFGQKQ